jgi:sodium/potassium/calcium exchanger 6
VFGIVTLAADVKVTRRPYIRDVSFYLISVAFTFYLFMDNKALLYESVLLLVWYIIYVIVVVVGRVVNQSLKKRRLKKEELQRKNEQEQFKRASRLDNSLSENLLDPTEVELNSEIKNIDDLDSLSSEEEAEEWIGWNSRHHKFFIPGSGIVSVSAMLQQQQKVKDERDEKILTRGDTKYYLPKMGLVKRQHSEIVYDDSLYGEESVEGGTKSTLMIQDHFDPHHSIYYDEQNEQEMEPKKRNKFVQILLKIYNKFCDLTGWQDKKLYEKILFLLVEWYTTFVRNLTIPKADETEWNRFFAVLIPIFSPVVILIASGCKLLFRID